MTVVPIGPGVYRVEDDGQHWTVAVAGPPRDRWVWVDGQVWRLPSADARGRGREGRAARHQDLTAPMPATVVQVAVSPGQHVAKGDTLVMLEAMKMELPIRAPQDGVVKALHCVAGELVQPGTNLVELE